MAYTKQQAKEYYENYTKKGLLKGRKKGKKKKKTSKKKNSKKKAKAVVVRKYIGKEKKKITPEQRQMCNEECKYERERIAAQKKEFMKQYREQVKDTIDALRAEMREKLKGMPKGPEKDALKAEYQSRISDIQALKKQQTEQFNVQFQEQKENTVNNIRKKYGLEPLNSYNPGRFGVSLTEQQANRLTSALEQVRKK